MKFKRRFCAPTHLQHAVKVGEIIHNPVPSTSTRHVFYTHSLKLDYAPDFPVEAKKLTRTIVYFMFINGELYKIGQTSGQDGIEGCINFYLNAGLDDPGINRFAINYLMRQELALGNRIELYYQYMEPLQVLVPGLTGTEGVTTLLSAKSMEEVCLRQHKATWGRYPKWNFQEKGEGVPSHIHTLFGQYKIDRKAVDKNQAPPSSPSLSLIDLPPSPSLER